MWVINKERARFNLGHATGFYAEGFEVLATFDCKSQRLATFKTEKMAKDCVDLITVGLKAGWRVLDLVNLKGWEELDKYFERPHGGEA